MALLAGRFVQAGSAFVGWFSLLISTSWWGRAADVEAAEPPELAEGAEGFTSGDPAGRVLNRDEHRVRVAVAEGVLLIYDAANPAEAPRERPGYVALWHDAESELIYLFDELLFDDADFGAALASLEHRFDVPAWRLAVPDDGLLAAWLMEFGMRKAERRGVNDRGADLWQPVTRCLLLERMGFDARRSDLEPPAVLDDPCASPRLRRAAVAELDEVWTGSRVAVGRMALHKPVLIPPVPSKTLSPEEWVGIIERLEDDCAVPLRSGGVEPTPPDEGCCLGGDPCCYCEQCCGGRCCGAGTSCCFGLCCHYCCEGYCCRSPCCETVPGGCCTNPGGVLCCGTTCCQVGQRCCPGPPEHCCAQNDTCCGLNCCSPGSTCCPNNTHCCPGEQACCGTGCCLPGHYCCEDQSHCCPENTTCCGENLCCGGETPECVGGPARDQQQCCPSGQTLCGGQCCNPSDCCNDQCCPSGQTCCNGSCGPKGRCCFFSNGTCLELTAVCCAQQGGTYSGNDTTCSPGDICKPKCESCKPFQRTFHECGHFFDTLPGTPCATDWCLTTVLDTAGCTEYTYRVGPPKCNTREVPGQPVARQWEHRNVPCPAMILYPTTFFSENWGCGEACNYGPNFLEGCTITSCSGGTVLGPYPYEWPKKACGCSP